MCKWFSVWLVWRNHPYLVFPLFIDPSILPCHRITFHSLSKKRQSVQMGLSVLVLWWHFHSSPSPPLYFSFLFCSFCSRSVPFYSMNRGESDNTSLPIVNLPLQFIIPVIWIKEFSNPEYNRSNLSPFELTRLFPLIARSSISHEYFFEYSIIYIHG